MRYYFNIDNAAGIFDTVGTELPTLAAAKCEALRYASKIICDDAERFWDAGEFQMTIADEKRLTLFSLQLNLTSIDAPAVQTRRAA